MTAPTGCLACGSTAHTAGLCPYVEGYLLGMSPREWRHHLAGLEPGERPQLAHQQL